MKTIALIVCALAFGSVSAATQHHHHRQPIAKFEQRVEVGGVIEEFLNNLISKLAAYDPIAVSEYSVNILGFHAAIKNLAVSGFSDVLFEVSVDAGLNTHVRMSCKIAQVSGSVESWESTFPIVYGKGSAGFEMNAASALFEVEYKLFGGFQPSNIVISIGNAEFKLTGAQNNEVLSQQITDSVNNALNNVANSPEFHSSLEAYVDSMLSIFLANKTKM